MNLLACYVNAVRAFLPKTHDQQDILSELSSHLQIRFEEREAELGRALTEDEQAAVLSAYGTPIDVAARYGATNLGLSFGRQLIGPEIFLLYRRILLAQFLIAIVVITIIGMYGGAPGGMLFRYLGPMLGQFIVTTTIFIAIDAFKRRSRTRAVWNFPPTYMQPVPRWQSISGFVTLSVFAIWWAAIPYAPFLLLGPLSARLELAPGWLVFYWPVLTLLLIGAGQRLVTLVEPEWSWLQTTTRLLTNGAAVALLYPFLRAVPYVVAIGGMDAERIAERVNNTLWWNSWASFGLYWLINGLFMLWLCGQHVMRRLRKRREQVLMRQSVPLS